jgi:hypothetical protein
VLVVVEVEDEEGMGRGGWKDCGGLDGKTS